MPADIGPSQNYAAMLGEAYCRIDTALAGSILMTLI
jgi:hypothetical protein